MWHACIAQGGVSILTGSVLIVDSCVVIVGRVVRNEKKEGSAEGERMDKDGLLSRQREVWWG
jgi:hypothetical protein